MGELTWDEIKENKGILLELLREEGSQYKVGQMFDKDHKAVKYWMDEYGITVEDYKNVEPKGEQNNEDYQEYDEYIKEKNSLDKEKPIRATDNFEEYNEYYLFFKENNNIPVDKKVVQEFRELYCGSQQFTLNRCEREMKVPREKLKVIKTALEITHDSMPFLEEEVREKSVDEMTKEEILKKKDRFFKKMRHKEYEEALKDLEKYYEKDYFYNKMTNRIIDNLDEIEFKHPEFYEMGLEEPDENSVVINITDWHKGKVVLSHQVLGFSEYNKDIYKKMKEKYIKEAIKFIKEKNPEKVYILNYGDGPDGPNSNVYDGQTDHQDVQGEKQVVEYAKDLKDFVLSVYDYQPNIYYSAVPGNHSKARTNWDVIANMILEGLLEDYETIKMDVRKIKHKIIEVYDSRIIQTHGQDIRTGKYTGENDVLNMINMEELPFKKTYVVHGHLHHERVEGTGYKRIFLPSPVGGDDLSNNIMHTTSRPAQLMFVMDEDGLKDERHVYFD
jgi:predicted phosphodiesterase